MNLDEMTIGQLKEIKSYNLGSFEAKESSTIKELGKCIVILQRGWVMYGYLFKTGSQYSLQSASVIRNWGTTKGLGEIAKNGPTEKTILDPIPETFFHELTTVAIIRCEK